MVPIRDVVKRFAVTKRKKLMDCIEAIHGTSTRPGLIKFAHSLGVSEGAVKKWVLRARRPRYAVQKKIEKITNGRMGLADW